MSKIKYRPTRLYDKNSIYFITFHTFRFRQTLNNSTLPILYQVFCKCQKELKFKTFAYVFLQNHCHLLLMPVNCVISKILFRIKGSSAYHINKSLNKTGNFWENNYYDHIIRNEKDFFRHFNYIHYNPIKHNLVNDPKNWPWSSYSHFKKQRIDV